jgi:hypothetical protein
MYVIEDQNTNSLKRTMGLFKKIMISKKKQGGSLQKMEEKREKQ